MVAKPGVVVKIKTKKTHGLNESSGIPSIIKAVHSNSAANAYNFARRVQTSARRRCHVITGRLQASIKAEKIAYGKHRVVVGAHYGVYEEYGTRYRPPHPFFRPAVEENRVKFMQDMKKVFHR